MGSAFSNATNFVLQGSVIVCIAVVIMTVFFGIWGWVRGIHAQRRERLARAAIVTKLPATRPLPESARPLGISVDEATWQAQATVQWFRTMTHYGRGAANDVLEERLATLRTLFHHGATPRLVGYSWDEIDGLQRAIRANAVYGSKSDAVALQRTSDKTVTGVRQLGAPSGSSGGEIDGITVEGMKIDHYHRDATVAPIGNARPANTQKRASGTR